MIIRHREFAVAKSWNIKIRLRQCMGPKRVISKALA